MILADWSPSQLPKIVGCAGLRQIQNHVFLQKLLFMGGGEERALTIMGR